MSAADLQSALVGTQVGQTKQAPRLKSFAIAQVANGFAVTPVPGFQENGWRLVPEQQFVFTSWADASKWIGDQFKGLA